ncbi:hypothetical protein LIER_35652 [Lithospermum erythrorhizon]|uniref:Reverse transcriptase domain-containing protein n=1 Tax=Lithospermum erythrorhizon TaxID=34254 RepID=A0AAV3NVS2_LITER
MAAIKIDMSKAFDRVKWNLLFSLLEKLLFSPHWIQLIRECVTTVQCSVIVNGQTSDTFSPNCGLKQEDPLSPILFAICTEALSSTLHHYQLNNQLKRVSIAKQGPHISQLLLAEDCYFFIHLDHNSVSFSSAINIFCKDAGQITKHHKSIITFSPNTPTPTKSNTLHTLGIIASDTFGSYLGIPLDITTNRRQIFINIVDKIKRKILSWKSKFHNLASRVTLIKSGLQAILV